MKLDLRQSLFDTDEELDQLVKLQNIVYQDRGLIFNKNNFVCWYLRNPSGRVISFNAFEGENMVAHYACVPVKMKIDDKIIDGLLDMATVTHPKHRRKGLFRTLAQMTYDYAAKSGYEFVIGVANANSFPGYMKYFNFTFVSRLDVKWSFGINKYGVPDKKFSMYWDTETLIWRLGMSKYFVCDNAAYGKYGHYPFFKAIMGCFNHKIEGLRESQNISRSIYLYVGLGANLRGFHNFPKFIKHSPFNLIFLDLTDGKLPAISKDNVFFQLIDFDVV